MIENIFEITLSMSIVVIVVLLFSPVLEKRYSAKWRYFIWLFIALRLIIPFNITIPKAPINITPPKTNIYIGVNNDTRGNANLSTNNEVNKSMISTDTVITNTNKVVKISLLGILENIWLLGMIIFIGYNLLNYGLFRRHIKYKANEVKLEAAKDIKNELKLKYIPKIVVSNEILSPMLVGFVKPMVILPEIKYLDKELKVILKHEFMHYKRRDLWYKLLLIIANGVHWFNPIIYFMVRQANRDLEYSCDDDVVKNENMEYRKEYSMTILKSMENSKPTALSTYLSKSGEDEKERFKNVLKIKNKKKGIIAFCVILAFLCAICICIKFPQNNVKENDNNVVESDKKKSKVEEYYDYFYENNQLVTLLDGANGGNFSDDDMAAFATLRLKNPDLENGNRKEEYNNITEKYFGKKINNFNNSKTYIDSVTGLIKSTGWSFDSTVFMSLISLTDNEDGTKTADFYVVNISDGIFEDIQKTSAEIKSDMLNRRFDEYGEKIPVVRINFEEKKDDDGNMYIKYLSLKYVEG